MISDSRLLLFNSCHSLGHHKLYGLLELTALLHLVNSILAEKNLYSVLMFFLLSQKFCSCVLVPTVSIFLCCIGLQISITSFL
jgi:hypothetical protein